MPHDFAPLQGKAPSRGPVRGAPHQASIALTPKASGALAAETEAANGASWERSACPLSKFLAGKTGKAALRQARNHYKVLMEAARSHLAPADAGALVKLLTKDVDYYCGDDIIKQVRGGAREATQRCELFYGTSKPYLELVAGFLQDSQVDRSKKKTAMANLLESLGKCEMSIQNAFATAFQDLGGFGGARNLLQLGRKQKFEGLVEEFVLAKEFSWCGRWTRPDHKYSADREVRNRRVGSEVHIKPALARAIGADDSLGLEVGVAANDRFASKIGFHEADLAAMAVELYESARMPQLISNVASDVSLGLGQELRAKLKGSAASGAGIDDVFGKPIRDDQLQAKWYQDFSQYAATQLGVEFLSATMSIDMDGACVLSRNTGALQRRIIDSLAGGNGNASIFRDELAVHDVARTEGFMLERRGPVWVVRDREDGGQGYAGEFRSLRLKDLAELTRTDPASRMKRSAWTGMPPESRELLLQWVNKENRPAFYEEAMELVRQPGAYRNAIASSPPELKTILEEAMSLAFNKSWDVAKLHNQSGWDPTSLDTMMAFYRQTDLSLPVIRERAGGRTSQPEELFLSLLARTGRKEAIAELLTTRKLGAEDPLAFIDLLYTDKRSRDWFRALPMQPQALRPRAPALPAAGEAGQPPTRRASVLFVQYLSEPRAAKPLHPLPVRAAAEPARDVPPPLPPRSGRSQPQPVAGAMPSTGARVREPQARLGAANLRATNPGVEAVRPRPLD